jgi:hypothetical protein
MADDQGPRGEIVPTEAEARLIAFARQGRRAHMDGAVVRASVLRALAIGARPDWPVQPVGLRVYNAVIDGRFDLEGCTIPFPVLFFQCRFAIEPGEARSAILIRDARLPRLGLYECAIEGGVLANRARIETGIFMRGAKVTGRMEMRGIELGGALTMEEATFEDPRSAIMLDAARIGGPLILRGSTVRGEVRLTGARIGGGILLEEASFTHSGPAFIADGIAADGPLVLSKTVITGGLQLRGAQLRGVHADDLSVSGERTALNAQDARVTAGWTMQRAKAKGAILLEGLRLTGNLVLDQAQVEGSGETALSADGADVSGWCSLAQGRFKGAVRLAGATVADRVLLDGADIDARYYALLAEGLRAGHGLTLRGAKLAGTLNLMGAEIGHALTAHDITIEGRGRAIEADVIRIGGNWMMRGAKLNGSVRLPGATIDGQLALTGSEIAGDVLAIRADGARIRGGWFMGRSKVKGIVRFPSAEIGNQVRFRGSHFSVRQGPAVFANGTTISRDLMLDSGFRADGAVVLHQLVVNGTVDLRGSTIRSAVIAREGTGLVKRDDEDDELSEPYDELSLSLVDARLDRLEMPETAECRPRGIVDFSRLQVGAYVDHAAAWPPPLRRGRARPEDRFRSAEGRDLDHLILDGFTYDHLENPTGLQPGDGRSGNRSGAARMRIRWLYGQADEDLVRHFKPQSWVALASRLAGQGYVEDARALTIARLRRERRSSTTGFWAYMQSLLLDVLALYGFNPWRTVGWMALAVLLFAGAFAWGARDCLEPGCADETVYVRSKLGDYAGASYPVFNSLAFSLDVFVPFISFGYEDHWRPNLRHGPLAAIEQPFRVTLTKGGLLYVLELLEMVIGLVLTSLAVTGFTGLLRRDGG